MISNENLSGIKLPEVCGMGKNLDHNVLPEKQSIKPIKVNKILQEKPEIGQRRAEMRRRRSLPLIKLLLRHQNFQRKFLKHQK